MAKVSFKSTILIRLLEKRLLDGTYNVEEFPSERQLSQETGLSLTCVRRAVAGALDLELLERGKNGRIGPAARFINRERPLKVAMLAPVDGSYSTSAWLNGVTKSVLARKGILRAHYYLDEDDPVLLKTLGEPHDLIFLIPPREITSLLKTRFKQAKGRIVSLYRDLTDYGIPLIDNSPLFGMRVLLDHLRRLGHKRIDCIRCQRSGREFQKRVDHWQNFLGEHGLNGELHDAAEFRETEIERRVWKFMRDRFSMGNLKATAILALTIESAVGTVRAARDSGLKIPTDLSLAAFGPASRGELMSPSITSLQEPAIEEIVSKAFDLCVGKDLHSIPLIIEPEDVSVFEGESTRRPANKYS
jgi:DNA-binding LacI/PurR family transcriptional regulator